jgi:ABC-type multidrug transport system fused ATPase/permease subunit
MKLPRLAQQLLLVLSSRHRWQVVLLLVAMVCQAAVELVGVASIAPFMSVAADPGVIHRNGVLQRLYELGGFASETAFLVALGLAVIGVIVLSSGVSAAATWAMLRYAWAVHHHLANRLLRGYLAQPYAFFVECNTANLHRNLLAEVQSVASGVLIPALTVVARSLVTLAIVVLLVAIDPLLALIVVLVLAGAYGLIYLIVRRRQGALGFARMDANRERYKVAGEAFGGIKDVKVLQREAAFASRFVPPSASFSRAMASNTAIAQLPRYLLEAVAFGGILLIVLFSLHAGLEFARILPTLSLYAFAGYRLMPTLQQIFAGVTQIRFNRAALDELSNDLERFRDDRIESHLPPALPFQESIDFDAVTFRYPGASRPALDAVSLSVPLNQTIGLVGASGSGKTTLVDLLLGLYQPMSGRILVDGVELDEVRIPAWRQQVGYVPQQIFLSDDTIASNIAFGVPHQEIDVARVERAARIAHLHDFVQALPDGYETVVGERGVRLSGGQRQRIGIARALYHEPAVLVLDEATSALDGATEEAVMDAIRGLAGHKTIVLIAHRLSTVRDCDRIFLFDQGRLACHGTFDELAASSPLFRAMAKLNSADGHASGGSMGADPRLGGGSRSHGETQLTDTEAKVG